MAKTNKMMTIDRGNLRVLSEEILAAVQTVGEKYGIAITAAGGHYGHSEGDVKLALRIAGTSPYAAQEQAFTTYATLYGLKTEWLGQNVLYSGKAYTILGLRSGAQKYPVMARRDDGKVFYLPAHGVAAAMKLTEIAAPREVSL